MKITIPSRFIKPEDVADGNEIEILEEAQWEHNDQFDRDVLQCEVKLPNGEVKTITLNNTSIRWITDQLGDESKNWIGKKVPIYKLKQNVRGKVKDVLYIGIPENDDDDIPVVEGE